MTPEQKEAYRREVLEEAAKVADAYHKRALEWAKKVRGLSEHIEDTDSSRIAREIRALAASQPAPAADTAQAVAWRGYSSKGEDMGVTCLPWLVTQWEAIGYSIEPLYTAPLDADRVREAWAYRVHDCHIARSPVKARAKFPEATEHLYPASRHADAIEMARLLGGTCTPLYPPEDAR